MNDKDIPFMSVSWIASSPEYLKVEGRRAVRRFSSYEHSVFEAGYPDTEKDRKFFVLTLLDPETAQISP